MCTYCTCTTFGGSIINTTLFLMDYKMDFVNICKKRCRKWLMAHVTKALLFKVTYGTPSFPLSFEFDEEKHPLPYICWPWSLISGVIGNEMFSCYHNNTLFFWFLSKMYDYFERGCNITIRMSKMSVKFGPNMEFDSNYGFEWPKRDQSSKRSHFVEETPCKRQWKKWHKCKLHTHILC